MDRDPREDIDALRRRIETRDRDVSDADADALLAFSDRLDLLSTEYSNYRHLKLLRHCVRMAEKVGDLHCVPDDREAAEDIVRWIHRTYDNEETNRDYRSAIRVFAKRVAGDDDECPPAVDWVPTGTSRSYDPSPDPAKMLRWDDDVRPMLDESRNARDAAAIALQFDAGLRSGECFDLTIGDLSDSDHGLQVRVDGKTGERTVTLIPSVPHVNRWLDNHPAREDPDAPLWSHLGSDQDLSYNGWMKCFKVPANRAGVEKPVTPRNFRRSNASWLARQGANAALIEDRQGRERGSDAVGRYVAAFGDDEQSAYAALQGREVEADVEDDLAPISCPRCDRETPHDEPVCVWCSQALDVDASEVVDEIHATTLADTGTATDADDVEDFAEFRRRFDNDPEFRAAVLRGHGHDSSSM